SGSDLVRASPTDCRRRSGSNCVCCRGTAGRCSVSGRDSDRLKIVADESVDRQIVDRLRMDGHDVMSIAELDPGIDDETVLGHSLRTNAILMTADKDFGELVFRQRLVHSGVLLIRLAGL